MSLVSNLFTWRSLTSASGFVQQTRTSLAALGPQQSVNSYGSGTLDCLEEVVATEQASCRSIGSVSILLSILQLSCPLRSASSSSIFWTSIIQFLALCFCFLLA